jgi:ribosome biogenesis GTPase A
VQPLESATSLADRSVHAVQNQDGAPVEPVHPLRPNAHGWLEAAAARHTSGDTARMAQRFLDDFRRGMLGPLALELP